MMVMMMMMMVGVGGVALASVGDGSNVGPIMIDGQAVNCIDSLDLGQVYRYDIRYHGTM